MKTADKTRETPAFPKTFIMAMIFGVGLNPVNSTLIPTRSHRFHMICGLMPEGRPC